MIVLHDGAGMDELEGVDGEMGVVCEGDADGIERGVWCREVKGDSSQRQSDQCIRVTTMFTCPCPT